MEQETGMCRPFRSFEPSQIEAFERPRSCRRCDPAASLRITFWHVPGPERPSAGRDRVTFSDVPRLSSAAAVGCLALVLPERAYRIRSVMERCSFGGETQIETQSMTVLREGSQGSSSKFVLGLINETLSGKGP
jgi:hypothetical protein